jgi:hypothetical protein
MWNRRIVLLAALLSVLMVLLSMGLAQAGQRGAGGRGNNTVPSLPHDPHDLSGVWLISGNGGGRGNTAVSQWTSQLPSMTPEGLAKMNANQPALGPRAIVPAKANDPLGDANPPGLLRTLVYGVDRISFVQLPDQVLQVFEWANHWRQIWTDGRKIPENIGPFWYGYSVGRWEGDTFVVETAGLDSREWLDGWGNPFSDDLRIEERWHRLDRDNLELTVKFDDPKTYTKPWVSDKKIFKLQRKGTPGGELLEIIFAPMDENSFNENIRNPAGGVSKK